MYSVYIDIYVCVYIYVYHIYIYIDIYPIHIHRHGDDAAVVRRAASALAAVLAGNGNMAGNSALDGDAAAEAPSPGAMVAALTDSGRQVW